MKLQPTITDQLQYEINEAQATVNSATSTWAPIHERRLRPLKEVQALISKYDVAEELNSKIKPMYFRREYTGYNQHFVEAVREVVSNYNLLNELTPQTSETFAGLFIYYMAKNENPVAKVIKDK